MKPLMLQLEIERPKELINYTDKIMLIGSCFSDHIGELMYDSKLQTLQNPNGILFNPFSITRALDSYISLPEIPDRLLYNQDGLWHSWDHHSNFSAPDEDMIKMDIEISTLDAHTFLKESSWLIITLGSAWYYTFNEDGKPVANCHKVPTNLFEKKLAGIQEMIQDYDELINKLISFNPDLHIIFTISPVRHIKDGIVENNISKSRLTELVYTLTRKYVHVFYFPSYELVIDVLRDYRFYKEDMVHPSQQAVEYVFERFMITWLTDESKQIFNEINKWKQDESHRALNPGSEKHLDFLKKHDAQTEVLKNKYPYLNF